MIEDELFQMTEMNKGATIGMIEIFPIDADNCIGTKRKRDVDNSDSNQYYFFCGAVLDCRGHIIGIPNRNSKVLDITPEINLIEQWGTINLPEQKGWTGGYLAPDNYVYAFPRGANSYLKIDTIQRNITQIPICHQYNFEHHYGGAVASNNIIYQPPKGTNTILKFDIDKKQVRELPLKSFYKKSFLYYGAISDLDDNVYFFPAGRWSRVAMINKDGKAGFIGPIFHNVFFNSGVLDPKGNIVGFSSYGKGILFIERSTRHISIIERKFHGGYFGARLGFNGKLYGIPGDTDEVVEFDPDEKRISNVIPLPDIQKGIKAKCAGSAIDRYGNIWCVPAKGKYIYKIIFSGIRKLPSDQLYYSKYFNGTY